MTRKKRWIIECDYPGCPETLVIDGGSLKDATDHGWTVSSKDKCPDHRGMHTVDR